MAYVDFNQKSYYSFYFKRNKYGVLNFVSPTMFQFVYIEEGEIVATYAKGDIRVKAGELLYFPTGIQWDVALGDCEEIKGVLFNFRNWPDVDELDYPPQVIKVDDALNESIKSLPIGDTKINSSYLWRTYRFLTEIQSYLIKNNNQHIEAIQKVLDFMRANDNYTIPQLVEVSGMKKSTFYKVFEDLTGTTPILTKHRFQAYKAEVLLSTTDLSVEEIAHRTGFDSVAHFRKIFKSRYSASPKKIRKQG